MAFLKYVFTPKLYKEYGVGSCQKLYEPGGFEKWGDQIISTLSLMWNIGYYTSPLIITFLYRRGYFVAESIASLAKFTTGIGILVVITLCMRGYGRSQSQSYVKFFKALDKYRNSPSSETRKALAHYDFDFKKWPIDFDANSILDDDKKNTIGKFNRTREFWRSSLPCEIAAYIAIHTFGIRMIYPGSVKLLQKFFEPILIQGRCKMIEEEKAERYKLKTRDLNEIDTIFVDNRNNHSNGKILVICTEGNAGFYEIGIMSTPISLKYSVLGWNHPGFAGSTGQPYPTQDQHAIDAAMQFAIHKLGFAQENILLFGWSIGAYASLWVGSYYPEIRGIILDATFDDVLHLALPKMPEIFSGIVKLAIREYVNLNHTELINQYNGPVYMIRRTKDEIICTEENNMGTNRGNYLLLNMLKYRFPNIFKPSQVLYTLKMLEKPLEATTVNYERSDEQLCLSLLTSYAADNGKAYPMLIGEDYNDEQRNQLADFLIRKHLRDFKSTHCTPLPDEFFQMPWEIPSENDFVFT